MLQYFLGLSCVLYDFSAFKLSQPPPSLPVRGEWSPALVKFFFISSPFHENIFFL